MTGAGYFVLALLSGLVLAMAAFIVFLTREHARERRRLYSMAFATTTPELVALIDQDRPEPALPRARKVAPKPADEEIEYGMEPVGGAGFGL